MSERQMLIVIHTGLMLLQIVAVGLALGVDSKFSGLSVPISGAQVFFPNPFKQQQ